ncbi:MAG: Gfo/Idh/MocA family oxidoreductase [Chloroflexota bacterium]
MNKEERRLRIGVLGCGPIAQFAHLDACRKARNAELYAICDAAEDLLERMAAVHAPQVTYRDYQAMLADPQVEAVIVATADQFHVQLCLQALEAGKHVLVEKPLGVGVEECERLAAQVRATGLVLQVGNNRRFDPGVAFAQRFIREEIGDLIGLKAWYYDSAFRYTMTDNLQPLPVTSANARRPEGNPKADRRRYFLLTHGSHLVDTARFLGGEIDALRARYSSRLGAHCWFVDVAFASGALGHLDMTIAVQGDFEEGFQLFGAGGSAKCRAYLPWYHKCSEVECFSARDREYRRPLGEDAYTYKRQIEGFADTILHGLPQHGASVDDGTAAVRCLVAIARSAEHGDWVRPADVSGSV